MPTNPIIKRLQQGAEGYVIAVQVRQVDPPQHIADDMEDLLDLSSRFWSGEQCDSCGCSAYTIEVDPTFGNDTVPQGWVARCSGMPDTADELASSGADADQVEAIRHGCGATYSLRWYHESEVAF
jgi:hypothetical protein